MGRKQIIGERIKTMRLARGMSQADLANALNCAQSTVAMWETGQRQPDFDMIDALADIFNVPSWSITYSEAEVAPTAADDEEVWEEREFFRRNPNLRVIFDLERKASKEQLKQIEAFIRFIQNSNNNDDTK